MAYLGKTPSQAVRSRYYFTASGGETSLAPTEVTGLSFTDANYVDVSLNGVALVSGTDYTATPSTNTISGLAALTASDVVEIVVYDTFSVFGGSVNGDFNISGGTLSAEAVTVTGLTTTGNINFGDNDKANFGAGSDLQIYHDGSNSYIQDTATGQLLITTQGAYIALQKNLNETMAQFIPDGSVDLYHDNSKKLETTSTGIDVTGTVTATGATTTNSGLLLQSSSVTKSALNVAATANQGINGTAAGDLYNWTTGGKILWSTNSGTNAHLVLDSSGNVGIGTSSPSQKLSIVESGGSARMELLSGTSGTSIIDMGDTSDADIGGIRYENTNNAMLFRANNDERMRIDSSGNVGISNTTPSSFFAGARNLVVGSGSGNQGMTIFSGTSSIGNIKFADGTGSDAAKSAGGIRYDHSSNFMRFDTNDGTEAMRITSGGSVGIGTSSPTGKLHIKATSDSVNDALRIESSINSHYYTLSSDAGNGSFRITKNGTERLRIDSSGNVLVGTTDTSPFNNTSGTGTSLSGGDVQIASSSSESLYLNRIGSDGRVVSIRKGGSFIGGIDVSTSQVTYNQTSDYRLKENVSYTWDATARLKQLKPARFNYIVDPDNIVDGFLAHEVSEACPSAITGEKDAVDADGNIDPQCIDHSKLVPLLVKTIQELEARLTDTETRLTALENAE
jgi:hypothetical protein